ncbi:heparan-alpha-glucosaminide N-acetyltransferase domain-containing protein [Microbacterium sp. NPDC055903]
MSAAGPAQGAHRRSGRLAAHWRRLNGAGRIPGIDLARGLAVIGMLAAHLLETEEQWLWADPSTWSSIVNGRSSILFAVLAGVSIGLVTGAASPLPREWMMIARGRIAVRAGLLWVLGILLVLTGVPVYVILPAYGILFLLSVPFTGRGARFLLLTAGGAGIVMALLQPLIEELPLWYGPGAGLAEDLLGWAYPFTVWIAYVLAGMGLARADLTRSVTQLRMLVIGAGLAVVGYGLSEVPVSSDSLYLQTVWQAVPHSQGLLEVFGSGGFAVAVIGACLLVCRLDAVRLITLPMRATGAMPLTAYTAQILVWALVALEVLGTTSDLGAFRALDPFWPVMLGVVAGCTLWALLIGRGPLEEVVDRIVRLAVPGDLSGGRLPRAEAPWR